jgi:hypothetical protein
MRPYRALLLSVVASAFLCCSGLTAQEYTSTARIVGPVNETSLTTLKGNVPRLAHAEYDQGEASASTQLTHMRLVLSRSSEQQAALDKYLVELQDKSSPNYHKWLTPVQFGKLYGPADSDVAAVVAWLESHGLKLEEVSTGRTNISFSGTVSQVTEAFHTPIHTFTANGQQFYSNTKDPKIPAALATVVKGVAHLNTIKPKPQYVRGNMGKIDSQTHRLTRVDAASANGVRANLTTGSGTTSDPYSLYIVPGDAATIYNTPNTTFNANYTSGTSYTGSGVNIGIAGDATIDTAIVATYRSLFIGDSAIPIVNYCTSSTSCSTSSSGTKITTDDSDEAYLDIEISGGLAPGATIYYYASSDLFTGIEAAINANKVSILSLSFGECESDMSSDNQYISELWAEAASQGIAVTVSTGDSGSAGCDNPNKVTVASEGLQVSGFASTPYNIAVGGTDFYPLADSYSTYASTSEGSSSTYYRTAKSYIPESTWNNSTEANGLISANIPWTGSYSSYANIVAGSGGPSNCATSTGGCTGYSKPTWQRGTGVPSDGVRDLPDISLMAGSGWDDAVWLVCDNSTGKNSSGTTVTLNCQEYFDGFGGTSAAAPAFAGILALVQQKAGSSLGQAAEELYGLYNGSHASAIFHDVTTGNIAVPCTSGTTNCAKNAAGYYFENGYDTTTGYDLATGLGSVDVAQLLTYWGTAIGSATATVGVTPSSSAIRTADSLTVTAFVSGSDSMGTPTGTVTLSGGGYTSSTETLSGGSYSFTIPAYNLSAGTDPLTVTYSGDTVYAAATGSSSVTVVLSTFTLSAANISLTVGSSGSSSVMVTPVNGYTGTVTLTAVTTSLPSGATSATTPVFTGSTVTLSGTAGGTGTVTVGTTAATTASVRAASSKGAGWYKAAGGTALAALLFFFLPLPSRRWRKMLSALLMVVAVSFVAVGCGGGGGSGTTTKATPTVSVTPAKTTIAVTDSLSVAVAVSGSGSTPTGTVSLSGGGYTSSSQTLSSGSYTFTIPASSFTSTGSVTLTGTYGGDSNYSSGNGTSTITVNKAATTKGTYTVKVTGTGSDAAATTATITFTVTVN